METYEPSKGIPLILGRENLIRYGWALGIVCLAIALRVWLEPVIGKQAGVFFWLAILIIPGLILAGGVQTWWRRR